MIRLAIVTGVWKRPEIFAMFAAGVKSLQEHFKGRIEIICCVAGSEGQQSRGMVAVHENFFYTEVPNQPLGQKMNAAVNLSNKLSPDYCLMIGSDDIIGISLMERYFELMQRGIDYVYLTDCFFFDTRTKRGLYWGGYQRNFNRGKGAGIGRLISKRALDRIQWLCWPPGYDRILDTAFDKQMERFKGNKIDINLKRDGLFALDIKSSTNMTPFELWENSSFTDGRKILFENLPHHLAKLIYG
jgi:hypothetical protein